MKTYVATVQLFIESDDELLAADAVRHILSDYEMADGTLVNWKYLEVGDQRLTPTRNYDRLVFHREGARH